MRLATLALALLTLASCDATTDEVPPFRLLVEAVSGGAETVLADVEIPRNALVGSDVAVEVPQGIQGFDVRAQSGDSTGVLAVVSRFGPETSLIRFGGSGTSSTVFGTDATSVTFVSTDSLWTGTQEAVPVSVETALTTRRDTLRRALHRARPVRMVVEARGLPVAPTDLRLTVISPRDIRLAPIATVRTGISVAGGMEDETLFRNVVRLLRGNLGDRSRYVTRVEDVAVPPEAGPLHFDVGLDLLLLRVDAGL